MSTFATPINNIASTLATAHAIGDGALVLATGDGAVILQALSEMGAPSVSTTSPLRVTVVKASASPLGIILDRNATSIYLATSLTGDILSGLTATEGRPDQAFAIGDRVGIFVTAGTIADLNAAINALNLAIESISGGLDPFGFGAAAITSDALSTVNTALAQARIKAKPSRSWTPPLSANLAGWFEARNPGVSTEGARLAQWNDLSGHGRHLLQPTAALQPTLHLTQGNAGTPTVDFAPSNWMASAPFALLQQPFTVYIVILCRGTGTQNIFDGNSGAGMSQIYFQGGAAELQLYSGSGYVSVYPQTSPMQSHMLFRCVFNGASSTAYRFGLPGTTANPGANPLDGFTLGAYLGGAGGNINAQISFLAVYQGAHSANEALLVENYIRTFIYPEVNPGIVAHGDSLTAGYQLADPTTQSYPAQLQVALGGPSLWDVTNNGVDGRTMATMQTMAADEVIPLWRTARPRQVAIVWGGVNDLLGISAPADTPANVHNNLQTLCLALRAQGFLTIVITIPPSTYAGTSAGYESARQSYNSLIRTNYTNYADALADFGNDPNYGNPANTGTNTIDGLHLKAAGYTWLVDNYLMAAVNGLRAAVAQTIPQSQITGLPAALSDKVSLTHDETISGRKTFQDTYGLGTNFDLPNGSPNPWVSFTSNSGQNVYAAWKQANYGYVVDALFNINFLPGPGGPGGVNIGDNPAIYSTPNRLRVKTGATTQGGLELEGLASQTAPLLQLKGITQAANSYVMAQVDGVWADSTEAQHRGRLVLSAVDWQGTREGIRVGTSGTAALLGFFGATAVGPQSGDPGAALVALGLMTSATAGGGMTIGGAIGGSPATTQFLYVTSGSTLGQVPWYYNASTQRTGVGAAPFNAQIDISHNSTLSTRCLQITNTSTVSSDLYINSGTTTAQYGAQQGLAYYKVTTADPLDLVTNNRQRVRITSGSQIWIGDAATGTGQFPVAQVEIDPVSTTTVGLGIAGLVGQTGPLLQLFGVTSLPAKKPLATIDAVYVSGNNDALFLGRLKLSANDHNAATFEGLRIESTGSAAAVGFFGTTAAVQQTGGAATAGSTYTATEQGMLQKAYNALRTYGFLT